MTEVIADNPDTVFVIDYAGMLNYHDAALPNVNMKISAFMIFDGACRASSHSCSK
ncbi:hypothetical protein [Candidatus Burkholderia verschuerenii]|uniref:hypothetical protein n=1 Tax=Candidatus Burkholderia verschuerenii TaxID=242163 RepID=UPI000A64BA97|nr:hypothetical protein [Candidatus Burkholderia verschuerenii]